MDGQTFHMERNRIYVWVDADFASSDIQTRRSVTGYIIMMNNAPISWKSSLQRRVSSSSTEAEYRALHEASKEAIWLTRILTELGYNMMEPVLIFEDNSSTIAATQNPVSHSKLKHLDSIYHQIRDFVSNNEVQIVHIESEKQHADMMTKILPAKKHHELNHNIIAIQNDNSLK